ncbi:MAG: type II secretion system protein [Planctomycetota bacterium]|jgi:hypothetical protein
MKSSRDNSGVTLVEMLIVIAIIMILVSLVIGAAGRITNQAKEELTVNTMAIVAVALQQFHDYEYPYKHADNSQFRFPLDCNDNPDPADRLLGTLMAELHTLVRYFPDGVQHLPEYSGCEGMYFFLSRVAECRKTLGRIDDSLITSKDEAGEYMILRIRLLGEYPLLRIIDAWGTTLRYDYYDEEGSPAEKVASRRTFPLLISAGPDRLFGTGDDITSK